MLSSHTKPVVAPRWYEKPRAQLEYVHDACGATDTSGPTPALRPTPTRPITRGGKAAAMQAEPIAAGPQGGSVQLIPPCAAGSSRVSPVRLSGSLHVVHFIGRYLPLLFIVYFAITYIFVDLCLIFNSPILHDVNLLGDGFITYLIILLYN